MVNIIGAPTLDDGLSYLCERVAEAEMRGERNFIFCEDKLTLLCERAVLEKVGGTFLTEVTTFARFLSGNVQVLSKQGSVMQIGNILSARAEELTCFGKESAQVVYETIAQLSASRVDAELLLKSAEETEGTLARKLKDLALVFSEYERFLKGASLVDENGYLALLPEKMQSGILRDVNVFFVAFPSFTRQAQEGIRAAIENSASVTGIFLAGREDAYTNEGARTFRRVCEEICTPNLAMLRSSLTEDAKMLVKGLFSPDGISEQGDGECVYTFAAADEEEELERVAALIKKHVSEGLRYRDIVVLVSDENAFDLVGKVFSSYRIPYYADRKRPLSEHPFCKFVFSLLEGVQSGVLPHEADDVAANPYFGEGDEYRNYLARYACFRGGVKREIKEGEPIKRYRVEALRSARERMLSFLACFRKKGKGSDFTKGIRDLYEACGGAKTTERLLEYFEGAEREFLQSDALFSVLEEIDSVCGNEEYSAREFAVLLKNGTDALKVSMIPQNYDRVFVGDCTESKFARAEVLFATGLTDAVPRVSTDTAVINDGDIRRLASLQVEIAPAIAQVNARAKESLALNLTAFSERLYLSYSIRKGGTETARSELFSDVEKALRIPPMPDAYPYDRCETTPAVLRLFALKDAFEGGRTGEIEAYSTLYSVLQKRGVDVDGLLQGAEKKPLACGENLYFKGGYVSPSLLEKYFACPYAGFSTYGLRLREREQKSVLNADAGTIVHAVLEEVAKKLNDLTSEDDARRYAEVCARKIFASSRFSSMEDTEEGKYMVGRLIDESREVSAVAYRQLAGSKFRVSGLEETVTLPDLSLYGKTDRVDSTDEYVRIIDYKTGHVDDSAEAYYTGRKLQLQLYLKGVKGEKKAAGAFYFPAADGFTKEGENKYRMLGFYNGEDEVLSLQDTALKEGEKSEFFAGKRDGKFTDKGMSGEDFDAFLDYSVLVTQKAEGEMKRGNIAPSPYVGACEYCSLRGACAFDGAPRKVEHVKCADVVSVVKRERGEEE